jgi:hypothetical protein
VCAADEVIKCKLSLSYSSFVVTLPPELTIVDQLHTKRKSSMSGSKKQSHAGLHNVSGLQNTSAMTSLKEYFNPKAQHILADEFDDEF